MSQEFRTPDNSTKISIPASQTRSSISKHLTANFNLGHKDSSNVHSVVQTFIT